MFSKIEKILSQFKKKMKTANLLYLILITVLFRILKPQLLSQKDNLEKYLMLIQFQ